MDMDYTNFRIAADAVTTPQARADIITAATALAVATRFALPTEAQSAPLIYFNEQYASKAIELIDQLNEKVLLKRKMAIDLVGRFWCMRYCAAFPLQTSIPRYFESFLSSLTGADYFLEVQFLSFSDEHTKCIFDLASKLNEIFTSQEQAAEPVTEPAADASADAGEVDPVAE